MWGNMAIQQTRQRKALKQSETQNKKAMKRKTEFRSSMLINWSIFLLLLSNFREQPGAAGTYTGYEAHYIVL